MNRAWFRWRFWSFSGLENLGEITIRMTDRSNQSRKQLIIMSWSQETLLNNVWKFILGMNVLLEQIGLMNLVQFSDYVIMRPPKHSRIAFSAFLAEFSACVPRGLAWQRHPPAAPFLSRWKEVPGHVFEVQLDGGLFVGHILGHVEIF